MKYSRIILAAAISLAATSAAWADIKVGVVLSETGPAASLGIPEKKTVELFPKDIAGQKMDYVFMNDGSDPTSAVKAAKKLIDEDKVDVIIGSSITPNSLAMVDVVGGAKVPNISLAAGRNIVFPVEGNRLWVFNTPQTTGLMARAVVKNMAQNKFKTVAYIGFDDAYGQDWYNNFAKECEAAGIKIVANESYNRTATSVTGQALHILTAKPQAVLIGASGTPAVLPERTLKQVGYKGQIYQTHGVANPDFLRVCGSDCNGTILPVSPGVVAAQLPPDSPIKQSAMRYADAYDKAYGKNQLSQFSANAWDAGTLLEHAIPVALKKAQPSDVVAFRAALRDAIEGLKNVAGADGIYNMSPTDHNGLDDRAVAMVRIENGAWKMLK
ncbi:putative ABC-type branched-chain amino acid transport systems, periplasmic component [Thiomonas arsenitoxydans]|jgi:branched-chain amino acid transport system substrate-binding protein|uniref:ABC-type branched-chain amino acid transport systems, periplasmic component n=1 Tax=Thiomonas arsenitoxydans (strain DSM 22701 / CIP 110005 / 3As) TaxID=426114 RepID=D6CNJ9_THIA3|nr:ABC transporter substrate-binding protein [Thiomonas arsenitoxydans]CAZ90127.1 putative ABC-type branched-chain amino acid transport systems, periplasmic component [Thiomonas arsenitoxydans]CQR36921.1 putative ABC-type branched-chain amino acid transport systems, periplasmic component [Thiomonas arsenitoxydans]CQR38015.1 putative ABC-type branched-chain amino acid transport systems, periplasmic component [Thiomonas arsenitoxydans]CQR40586.1 putative ABC-type branched-chain amino acid transpo